MSGKNYRESVKALDLTKAYEPNEAMNAVIASAKSKFEETVELHLRLGVDPQRHGQKRESARYRKGR